MLYYEILTLYLVCVPKFKVKFSDSAKRCILIWMIVYTCLSNTVPKTNKVKPFYDKIECNHCFNQAFNVH